MWTPIWPGSDLLGRQRLRSGLLNGRVYSFLGVLGIICIGDLPA
jgi:hypothetical protein